MSLAILPERCMASGATRPPNTPFPTPPMLSAAFRYSENPRRYPNCGRA